MVQVTGTSSGTLKYTYDGLNQRVRVDKGSTYQEYDFNVAGQRVSIWNGTTNLQGQYYAGNRPLAYYKSGATHFQHQDWLGTERIRTTYNGAVEGKFTQLAFGDGYQLVSGSDTDDAHYASLDYDAPTQTSHAQFRELDTIHGRWNSPDPYDGSYDASNPQSFNRYAYALNNPLSFVDPSGLEYCTWNDDTNTLTCYPDPWQCQEYGNCPGQGGNPPHHRPIRNRPNLTSPATSPRTGPK